MDKKTSPEQTRTFAIGDKVPAELKWEDGFPVPQKIRENLPHFLRGPDGGAPGGHYVSYYIEGFKWTLSMSVDRTRVTLTRGPRDVGVQSPFSSSSLEPNENRRWALWRGSKSDVETDLEADEVPEFVYRVASSYLSTSRCAGVAWTYRWLDDYGSWLFTVEKVRHRGEDVVLIHREPYAEEVKPKPPPASRFELRRNLQVEREKTRWRVVVFDCRAYQATAKDGTPCLDTYTKAGFSSIRAAEEWIANHSCGPCCKIVDAHLELPWGEELFARSEVVIAAEKERLFRIAEERKKKRRCEDCDVTGADNPTVFHRPRINEAGAVLCADCALKRITPITDEDVMSDRITMHINRLGYEAGLPPEVEEFRASEEEWNRRWGSGS
jgi:hypothetical protein